jgi:hypothetical protein
MKKYSFEYYVYPPGPPFDHLPIGLKSGYESDMHSEINKKYEDAAFEEKLGEMVEELRKLRSPLPLDKYLEKALAVFIAPDEYSYRELI